jgi:hypothetical protein
LSSGNFLQPTPLDHAFDLVRGEGATDRNKSIDVRVAAEMGGPARSRETEIRPGRSTQIAQDIHATDTTLQRFEKASRLFVGEMVQDMVCEDIVRFVPG